MARRPWPEDQRHRLLGQGARRCRCLRRRVSVPPIIQKSESVVFARRFLELLRCYPGPRHRGGAARRSPLLPTGRCRCRKFAGGTRPPASVFWKSWAQVVERNGQCWGTTISAHQARHAPLSLPTYFYIPSPCFCPSSPDAYGAFHALSLLLSPGLDPHSCRTQKRCLELQAAEPGRKIWSDEGRKTSFSSGHRLPLPLPLTRLLVEQAQENAADFAFIPPPI